MGYLSTEALLATTALRERDEPSAVFGGTLRIRELTRRQYRECQEAARIPDTDRLEVDRWNAALFAAGVTEPRVTVEQLLDLPNRDEFRAEILRIAQIVIDLSEVGPGATKSGSASADAE